MMYFYFSFVCWASFWGWMLYLSLCTCLFLLCVTRIVWSLFFSPSFFIFLKRVFFVCTECLSRAFVDSFYSAMWWCNQINSFFTPKRLFLIILGFFDTWSLWTCRISMCELLLVVLLLLVSLKETTDTCCRERTVVVHFLFLSWTRDLPSGEGEIFRLSRFGKEVQPCSFP